MAADSGLRAEPIVLDTNIVLDLFLFQDPKTKVLKQALELATCQWISTQPMRDELEHVLAYPHIASRLTFYQLTAQSILAQFDQFAKLEAVAPKANVTCKDADDQKFIDLAVAHQSLLLSKDKAVLCMAKRLAALNVEVKAQLQAPITLPP